MIGTDREVAAAKLIAVGNMLIKGGFKIEAEFCFEWAAEFIG